jgi:ligand-binding SRPBCC domain-containing protein
MKMHVLERTQVLPIPIDQAWAFFSTPRNLALITPPELGLRIREPFDDRSAYDGQLIRYAVRPLLGIPLPWLTRIERVNAPGHFADTQLSGPYARWYHEHRFEAVPEGTRMHDRVEYALPLGPLGELMHRLLVRRRLERIFEFRRHVLEGLFPEPLVLHPRIAAA